MRFLPAIVAVAALVSAPAYASGPCKDAKGKFIKCPTAAAAPVAGGVVKDKAGKCHRIRAQEGPVHQVCP